MTTSPGRVAGARALTLLLGAAALAACTRVPVAVEPSDAAPTATVDLAPDPVPLTAETADGVVLAARLYGSGDRGIVLGHQLGGDADDWLPAVPAFIAEGYAVLLPDLRGHGASPGARGENAALDLAAAVAVLRAEGGADDIAVLGTSFSGVAAITVAVEQSLRAAVAVSPGGGVPPAEVDLPVLAVTTEGDASADFTRDLAAQVGARLVEYDGGAHGIEMLADPRLRADLLDDLLAFLEDPTTF